MPKLKTVCLWRLRHKQNARFSWFGMISGADLGGRGNLNCPQARRSPTPVPGSRAAQPAGGKQGSDWLPIFLPASGSGCGLLSSWLRVTANFCSASGYNVRTAGAMTINDIAQTRHRQVGHKSLSRQVCGKPKGLLQAKLRSVSLATEGSRIEELAAVLFGNEAVPACFSGFSSHKMTIVV